jgi:peptide chain release factor subunit 1
MITTETINRIVGFRGNGLPVVSLYARIPTDLSSRGAMVRSQVDSQLHEIRPMSEDRALGHDALMSIRGDIDRITGVAAEQRWSPGAVALFSCSGRGFFEEVQLPRGVRDRVMVDETPWVRAMLAVLDEYHRCCVAVIHRDSARTWELYQDEMRETGRLRLSADPGRNDNKAEELTKRHFRQVVTMLDGLYRTDGYELLAIGGHQPELPRFLEFLTSDLRGRVAGTFPVDEATFTLGEIKHQASVIVDRYERSEEERMVADAVQTAAAGGLAAVGLQPCLWAGSVAAVDALMVQDGAAAPGVICDHDRWLALAGQTCPLCARPVRHAPDIVDELIEVIIDEGGSIEHVCADTVLKESLVVASLRFPLPPEPNG